MVPSFNWSDPGERHSGRASIRFLPLLQETQEVKSLDNPEGSTVPPFCTASTVDCLLSRCRQRLLCGQQKLGAELWEDALQKGVSMAFLRAPSSPQEA